MAFISHSSAKPTLESITPASNDAATSRKPSGSRLAWLDALRGIAALVVVYQHFAPRTVYWEVHAKTSPWFEAGGYGVFVFFLISGYIIPASLERHGSVRRFWISRLFRLYPLWLLVFAAAVLLFLTGFASLKPYVTEHPGASLVAHAMMLQDALGVPNTVDVMWTLTYEMLFYLLVTALFIFGLHRLSAEIAIMLAITAVTVGGILPKIGISGKFGIAAIAVVALVLAVGGVVAVSTGKKWLMVLGGLALGGLAISLLGANQRLGAWEGLLIIAAMFTGTAIYRIQQGEINKIKGWLAVGGVFVAAIAAAITQSGSWGMDPLKLREYRISWTVMVVAVGLTFAVGMLLRNRRIPAVFAWLGLVSYSVYLLHYLLIFPLDAVGWSSSQSEYPLWVRLLVLAALMATLLFLAWLSYRFVEVPMQTVGRRVAKRLDAFLGADTEVLARPLRGAGKSGRVATRASHTMPTTEAPMEPAGRH